MFSFDVFGATFTKSVQKEESAAKWKKRALKKWKLLLFRGVLLGNFSEKTCKKGGPEPLLKQEHILLDSGRPRRRKKDFREVPDVSSTH